MLENSTFVDLRWVALFLPRGVCHFFKRDSAFALAFTTGAALTFTFALALTLAVAAARIIAALSVAITLLAFS